MNNLAKIRKAILNNPKSPLYDHLMVYIIDNGNTLAADALSDKNVRIHPNCNAGGVAGFTRGMIETLCNKDKANTTHVLLMDDDIVIDPMVLERTYIFLRYLKIEYQQSFIGGSMLRLDEPYREHELGGYMHDNNYIMLKNGYDLRDKIVVLDNEVSEGAEIAAWWYCCIPLKVVQKNGLPLPIFFHKDDMEYSMRNNKEPILLNGISVWHQPFESKSSSHIRYYDTRNLLILAALHFNGKEYGKKEVLKYLAGQIKWHIACYRYKEADLILKGIRDYFRGINWLTNLDAETQLQELLKQGYKKYPVDELEIPYDRSVYENSVFWHEGRLHHLIRKFTLNGYFLPARHNTVVPVFYPHPMNFYRVKKALNYEDSTKTGFITCKNLKEAFRITFQFIRICFIILTRYKVMRKKYRSEINKITSETFWKQYLGINAPKTDGRLR